MNRLAAICITLASTCLAEGAYLETNLVSLVLEADAVVRAKIVGLQERTFTVAIEVVVDGPLASGQEITVRKFQNWICASRWTPYGVNQQVLLFLKHSGEHPWQIIGAGCEGEWPCLGDSVLSPCVQWGRRFPWMVGLFEEFRLPIFLEP